MFFSASVTLFILNNLLISNSSWKQWLCFSVMLGSLWYGVPAACEWVSVMKIYRKQTFGLFCFGSQPYSIWSSADPVSYSGTYIWALFAMSFSFCYVLCCFLCNLRISTWSPSWDQHNDPNITEKKSTKLTLLETAGILRLRQWFMSYGNLT